MTPHARRMTPAARPAAREPVARRTTPDSRPTDIRRLVAAMLSAVLPGLGQAVNGRFRLARWLLIPAVVLIPLVLIATQLFSPVRLAAWAIHPAVLQTLLVLNVIVLLWRLIAVGQAFFDGRYPAVPGRLGFAGLVVLSILVLAPHAYAWQVGSAADKAFARVFQDGTLGDGGAAPGPVPRAGERINILLVGVDATKKRTAMLTDTMMVISLDPVGKTASMVSIPRDMVMVPLGNGDEYGPKINSLLGYAERNPDEFPNGPMRTLQDAIGALLGIPIHYYARIDFEGFIDMVDSVGGVDVRVKKDIEDPSYDGYGINKRGWSITKGKHRLDGVNALAYARVRKALGESDFTRAARQQEILIAMRQRMSNGTTLLFDLPDLLTAVGKTLQTDIPVASLPDLIVTFESVDSDRIARAVIRHPLVRSESTRYGDGLVPRLDKIRAMAAELFPEPGELPAGVESPEPSATPTE
jgi:polyisoprenyl-teichoic acid--peptidoglycan teichoic acid transferase